MQQLIQMIQDRTGLDEGKARTAVDTVVGFLKNRLPDPVSGQLDKALTGGERAESVADRVQGALGGKR